MIVSDIAKLLLHYSDQHTLAAAATADAGSGLYLKDVCRAINAGAQELFAKAPPHVSRRPRGAVLPAPKPITIASATQYSAIAGTITTFANWMVGCTVRLPGHPDNRLLSYEANVATFQIPLLVTGTLDAIVFGDAIQLDEDVSEVLPRPEIPDCRILVPAQSESALHAATGDREHDYGHERGGQIITIPTPGEPTTYWIEGMIVAGANKPRIYFRVLPIPDRAYPLKYQVKIAPPAVGVDDLDAENEGAACTIEIPIPTDWNELYLIPIILQRYTASPMFRNQTAKQEIGRQYIEALNGLQTIQPQADRRFRFRPRF